MPLVRIELFPGRSPALKQEIATRITQMLSDVAGIAPEATSVIFQETPPADWFVAGWSHAAAAAHGRID
mgnify:CR=1 FL=1